MDRIVQAFGIDSRDSSARIDFDLYVRIKCFMKYYLISRDEMIKMWLKIINPSALSALDKADLCDLFERFARGKI